MTLRPGFHALPLWLAIAFGAAGPGRAQEAGREVVLPPENVRFDYAQVLGVRPIYQVLRTTGTARVCDLRRENPPGTVSRMVGAVRNRMGRAPEAKADGEDVNCRMQPVEREFRRPIAYDVDYVYKGSKFRTRMARDPGNRLRIRVSITPQPVD